MKKIILLFSGLIVLLFACKYNENKNNNNKDTAISLPKVDSANDKEFNEMIKKMDEISKEDTIINKVN